MQTWESEVGWGRIWSVIWSCFSGVHFDVGCLFGWKTHLKHLRKIRRTENFRVRNFSWNNFVSFVSVASDFTVFSPSLGGAVLSVCVCFVCLVCLIVSTTLEPKVKQSSSREPDPHKREVGCKRYFCCHTPQWEKYQSFSTPDISKRMECWRRPASIKVVVTKTFWTDGATMTNTASLCQMLGGLRNRSFNTMKSHRKTIPALQQNKKEVGTRKRGNFHWMQKVDGDHWISAGTVKEAKQTCKILYHEYTAITGSGNKSIPPEQQVRQRRDQLFEGLHEDDYRPEASKGWRYFPSSTTHSSSSSSSRWHPSSHLWSTWNWDSWKSSSWSEQWFFFLPFSIWVILFPLPEIKSLGDRRVMKFHLFLLLLSTSQLILHVFVILDCNSLLLTIQFPDALTPEVQQYQFLPSAFLWRLWVSFVSEHSLFLMLVGQVLPQSLYPDVSVACTDTVLRHILSGRMFVSA